MRLAGHLIERDRRGARIVAAGLACVLVLATATASGFAVRCSPEASAEPPPVAACCLHDEAPIPAAAQHGPGEEGCRDCCLLPEAVAIPTARTFDVPAGMAIAAARPGLPPANPAPPVDTRPGFATGPPPSAVLRDLRGIRLLI